MKIELNENSRLILVGDPVKDKKFYERERQFMEWETEDHQEMTYCFDKEQK